MASLNTNTMNFSIIGRKTGNIVYDGIFENTFTMLHYKLNAGDIVLMYTGRDIFYGQADYIFKGCGVTAKATLWLYDKGIRVMGIDAWGWDMPLHLQAQRALEENKEGSFWSAHQIDAEYSHMERLVDLGALPSTGFKVACFPLKIKGASAAPARVAAILPS